MLEKQLLSNLVNKQRLTKSKYELYTGRWLLYSFVTTTRNTEECLDIMREKFSMLKRLTESWHVYKTVNGKRELLWYHKHIKAKRNRRYEAQILRKLGTHVQES